MEAYMLWMLSLGEGGMAGEYTLPADAVVDGHSSICEINLFYEQSLSSFTIVSLLTLTHEGSCEVVIDHFVSDVFITAAIV
jgi:hypothetical protein